MIYKKRRAFFIVVLLFVVITIIAININIYSLPPDGTPVLAEGFVLPDGYKELSFSNAGIHAIYEAYGDRIFIETRRGSRTTLFVRITDSSAPYFEMGMSIFDKRGEAFHMLGGPTFAYFHNLVQENPGTLKESTSEERHLQWKISLQALEALKKVKFNRVFTPEYNFLIEEIPTISSTLNDRGPLSN